MCADINSTYTRGTTVTESPQAFRPPRELSGGFPNRYRSLEFTTSGGETGDDYILVSMQVQENGEDKAGYFKVMVYLSETALGAPDAANTTTAVTTGVELYEHETDCLIEAMTDENGVLLMTFTNSGTDTKYVYAALASDIYNVGVITFTA